MVKLTFLLCQYQQQWCFNQNFLPLFDTIHLCIATLDYKLDNIIWSKHNNLLAFSTNKFYGSKSHMFNLNINTFSSNHLNVTEEFILKHKFELCIPPTRNKRELGFSKFELLLVYLVKHKPISTDELIALKAQLVGHAL